MSRYPLRQWWHAADTDRRLCFCAKHRVQYILLKVIEEWGIHSATPPWLRRIGIRTLLGAARALK